MIDDMHILNVNENTTSDDYVLQQGLKKFSYKHPPRLRSDDHLTEAVQEQIKNGIVLSVTVEETGVSTARGRWVGGRGGSTRKKSGMGSYLLLQWKKPE